MKTLIVFALGCAGLCIASPASWPAAVLWFVVAISALKFIGRPRI